MRIALVIIAALSALSGCTSVSTGVGGTSELGCTAPEGVHCQSISGVYANAVHHNLPSQNANSKPAETRAEVAEASVIHNTINSGEPIRAQTRTLRVWVAPWEDSEGDLNDQSYSYVVVDNGRWLIDHNRRNIANEFAPIRPSSHTSMPSVDTSTLSSIEQYKQSAGQQGAPK